MKRAEYDDLMYCAFNTAGKLVWNKDKYGSDPDPALRFHRLCRMAIRHQQQLIKRAGDILLCCEDLINQRTYLPIEYVWNLKYASISAREERYEDWHSCFLIFVKYFDFVKRVESPQNIKVTKKFLRSKGVKVSREDDIIECALDYDDYWVQQEEGKVSMPVHLSAVYGIFEYKLCRRICEYLGLNSNLKEGDLKRMYILAYTVCLYTAIKNELERLCNEMCDEGYEDMREIYGLPLDIRVEMQKPSKSVTKQPAEKEEKKEDNFVPITKEEIDALFDEVKKNKPKAYETLREESGQTGLVGQLAQQSESTPPEETEEKEDKRSSEQKKPMAAITQREQIYFDEAINEGLLKRAEENKYEWLYARKKSFLVYFFIKAYEPDSPPYKELGAMFGMQGLSKVADGLKRSQWYQDELKRQNMATVGRYDVLKDPPDWFPKLKDFIENIKSSLS